MMVGPLAMATFSTVASTGLTRTPIPMFMNGNWWSFTDRLENQVTISPTLSQKSIDNAYVWSTDSTQAFGDPDPGVSNNGHAVEMKGSFVNHKDLDTPASLWIATDVSNPPGGLVVGGINILTYDATNDQFILNKSTGRDLYTTPDLVTYTSVNGAVENDLKSELDECHNILHNGSVYVAYGIKSVEPVNIPDIYGITTSADLLTWTTSVEVPRLFFLTYYLGAWIGVGRDINGRDREIWRSADYITWTKQSVPIITNTIDEIRNVIIQANIVHFILDNYIIETTNGTVYTIHNKRFNIKAQLGSRTFPLYGRRNRSSEESAPSVILLSTVTIVEHGGKLLSWSSSLDAAPALRYPATSPSDAIVGFVGTASDGVKGVTGDGFVIKGFTFDFEHKEGFYLHNTGYRYFEYVIQQIGNTTDKPELGIQIPGVYEGTGLTSVFLSEQAGNGFISTSSGNLGVTHNFQTGQVVGFAVNFITATIDIYIDGSLLISLPNINTSALWTQLATADDATVKLNIGQEAFINAPSGVVAWADGYI